MIYYILKLKNSNQVRHYRSSRECLADDCLANGIEANDYELVESSDEPVLGYDGFLYLQQPEVPMDVLRMEKLAEINEAYSLRAGAVKIGTPDVEVETWTTQEQEAKNWLIDKTVKTPFIDLLAINRGIEKEELVGKVLEKSAAYTQYIATLTGHRQKLEDAIFSARTKNELEAVVW